jgi:uroporphyrinogen III methyltransferase/synthase
MVLHRCDVVIYDALVNEALIAGLPERIRRVYAGKRGGKPSTGQDEINAMLVAEARNKNTVARLKGGDPLLLGRGSEEMEYLHAHAVPYEIVPGISSALAACAYAGISPTHRSLARSVAIVTGHLRAGESIESLQIPRADTLVFLMAMKNLATIVEQLLSYQRFSVDTPAAIVRNATLPDQKIIRGSLGTIVSLKHSHGVGPPAIFITGETVKFADTLQWFSPPSLAGARTVLLRTPAQSVELVQALAERGATVVPWPVIRIQPRELAVLDHDYLAPFTMLIFTSPNGVRIFMDALLARGMDARSLHGKHIYTLGAGTARILKEYGVIADGVPGKYVAEGLLDLLPGCLHQHKVLIPRAAYARSILPDTLRQRGAEVTVLPVYDTKKRVLHECPVRDNDFVLFTSSSTATFFFEHPHMRAHIVPVCMGEVTAATVRGYHSGPVYVARNATIDALLDALEEAHAHTDCREGSDDRS